MLLEFITTPHFTYPLCWNWPSELDSAGDSDRLRASIYCTVMHRRRTRTQRTREALEITSQVFLACFRALGVFAPVREEVCDVQFALALGSFMQMRQPASHARPWMNRSGPIDALSRRRTASGMPVLHRQKQPHNASRGTLQRHAYIIRAADDDDDLQASSTPSDTCRWRDVRLR